MLFGMVQEERAAVLDKEVSYLQPASDYGPPEPVSWMIVANILTADMN